jgi:glycosyltransferase involved in cell wall biosynthesis
MTAQLYVTNGEDAGDPQARSGSAHYLTEALNRLGRPATPLKMGSLRSSPLRLLLTGLKLGITFKQIQAAYFTAGGQAIKWRSNLRLKGDFIDFCQISPARSAADRSAARTFKYIDTPLSELFRYPEYDYLSEGLAARLIEEERRSYQTANAIFTYSGWCREQIIAQHELPSDKVFVARSGANLPYATLDQATRAERQETLRLLFVGKDHRRKGLAFLTSVAKEIRNLGVSVEIVVIGPEIADVVPDPNLKPIGYLSKSTDLDIYADLIKACHFGVLWSSAEGLPNSLLECLSMGRPIISNDLPQVAQEFGQAAALIFSQAIDPISMARDIVNVWNNPEQIEALFGRAFQEREKFTWNSAASLMIQVMENLDKSTSKVDQ